MTYYQDHTGSTGHSSWTTCPQCGIMYESNVYHICPAIKFQYPTPVISTCMGFPYLEAQRIADALERIASALEKLVDEGLSGK